VCFDKNNFLHCSSNVKIAVQVALLLGSLRHQGWVEELAPPGVQRGTASHWKALVRHTSCLAHQKKWERRANTPLLSLMLQNVSVS